MCVCVFKVSSSCDSLDAPCAEYAKSYDAVVFDVLKVTPEEFAVSMTYGGFQVDDRSVFLECSWNVCLSSRLTAIDAVDL